MKVKKIILGVLVFTVVLSSIVFARGLLKDNIYQIANPINNSNVIVDKNGKVLLKTIDPDNEYISIVYDLYTEEPAFLSKTYMGEDLKEVKYDDYSYHSPTYRIVYYDLDGNLLDLDIDGASGYCAAWGKYLLIGSDNGTYIYDSEEKILNMSELRNFELLGKNLLLNNSQWNDGARRIEIYDRDVNQIKVINDYAYSYRNTINGKGYHQVVLPIKNQKDKQITINGKTYTTDDDENKVLYNFLDENGDFFFDNPVENEINNAESDVVDFISGNLYFKYDMAKKQYVSSPSVISDEEREKIIKDTSTSDFMKDRDEDKNIMKLQEKYNNEEYAWVDKQSYNNKNIYAVMYGGTIINEGTEDEKYVEYIDLYDNDLNLKIEHSENIQLLPKCGYFLNDKDLYDINFNYIMTFDEESKFTIIEKGDNIYIFDRFDYDYQDKEKFNLYDKDFKILKEGISDISWYNNNDCIYVTDDKNTYMYDKDFKLIKELGGRYIIDGYYDDDHMVFTDISTGRYGIMDNEAKILISGLKFIMGLEDEYFIYQNGFKYGLMDYDGNAIVSLSIFSTMKEDARLSDYDSDEIIE